MSIHSIVSSAKFTYSKLALTLGQTQNVPHANGHLQAALKGPQRSELCLSVANEKLIVTALRYLSRFMSKCLDYCLREIGHS